MLRERSNNVVRVFDRGAVMSQPNPLPVRTHRRSAHASVKTVTLARVAERAFAALLMFATSAFAQAPTTTVAPEDPGFKFVAGYLDKSIPESSGIVASRKHAGVFWTHNDSGNKPQVFAVDKTGKLLATYDIAAKNNDWEDIATDDAGHLYIAETGNNARRADRNPVVFQIDEPDPAQPKPAAPLRVTATYPFRYLDQPFDCEALFIWKDHGYLVSKQRDLGNAKMYRFPLISVLPVAAPKLELVTEIPLKAPVTAADLSADGKELLVLTVFGPYRFIVNGDLATAGKVVPTHVMFLQPDMEAGTLISEGVLVTAESGHVLLFTNEMFGNLKAGRAHVRETRLNLPRMDKSITIDGSTDDWVKHIGEQPVRCDPIASDTTTPTARIWAAWNADGLYIAARVPQADPKPLASQWFNGDAIELFFGRQAADRSPDYSDGDDRCYIGFNKNKDGGRGEVTLNWPRRPSPPVGAQVASKSTGDESYQVEAFLPAVAFGLAELKVDDVLRFNVSILTSGNPRRNWFLSASNNAGTWMSPLKWAVAKLE